MERDERSFVDPDVWRGRRVLVTGHTGFKGCWLTRWLADMGAEVSGLALESGTEPAMFELLGMRERCRHHAVDLRDAAAVETVVSSTRPSVVLHLAAQAIVRTSYECPLETLDTNVMGTANLLEAVRRVGGVAAVVVVTSDKCYENREWAWGYRENDGLGGHDPYSMSKAAAELVTQSYRRAFLADQGVAVASARAGNVIGGGDWATARVIPDAVRAFAAGRSVEIRSPGAVRPWQHVLEPLRGYLLLAQRCLVDPVRYARAYNFGPRDEDVVTVGELMERFVATWGGEARWTGAKDEGPHEAGLLRLDCSLARSELGWRPQIPLDRCVELTSEWYKAYHGGADRDALDRITTAQIESWGCSGR